MVFTFMAVLIILADFVYTLLASSYDFKVAITDLNF